MAQDSQQVLGDEIGRILSEAELRPEQAAYLRTAFIEMIQRNSMILSTAVEFPGPVENPVQKKNAVIKGITEIAKMILKNNIFKYEETKVGEGTRVTIAIHLIRNAGL